MYKARGTNRGDMPQPPHLLIQQNPVQYSQQMENLMLTDHGQFTNQQIVRCQRMLCQSQEIYYMLSTPHQPSMSNHPSGCRTMVQRQLMNQRMEANFNENIPSHNGRYYQQSMQNNFLDENGFQNTFNKNNQPQFTVMKNGSIQMLNNGQVINVGMETRTLEQRPKQRPALMDMINNNMDLRTCRNHNQQKTTLDDHSYSRNGKMSDFLDDHSYSQQHSSQQFQDYEKQDNPAYFTACQSGNVNRRLGIQHTDPSNNRISSQAFSPWRPSKNGNIYSKLVKHSPLLQSALKDIQNNNKDCKTNKIRTDNSEYVQQKITKMDNLCEGQISNNNGHEELTSFKEVELLKDLHTKDNLQQTTTTCEDDQKMENDNEIVENGICNENDSRTDITYAQESCIKASEKQTNVGCFNGADVKIDNILPSGGLLHDHKAVDCNVSLENINPEYSEEKSTQQKIQADHLAIEDSNLHHLSGKAYGTNERSNFVEALADVVKSMFNLRKHREENKTPQRTKVDSEERVVEINNNGQVCISSVRKTENANGKNCFNLTPRNTALDEREHQICIKNRGQENQFTKSRSKDGCRNIFQCLLESESNSQENLNCMEKIRKLSKTTMINDPKPIECTRSSHEKRQETDQVTRPNAEKILVNKANHQPWYNDPKLENMPLANKTDQHHKSKDPRLNKNLFVNGTDQQTRSIDPRLEHKAPVNITHQQIKSKDPRQEKIPLGNKADQQLRSKDPRLENKSLGNKADQQPRSKDPRLENKLLASKTDQQPRSKDPRLENKSLASKTDQQPRSKDPRLENKSLTSKTDQQPRSEDPRLENKLLASKTDQQPRSKDPRLENKSLASKTDQSRSKDPRLENKSLASKIYQEPRYKDPRLENKPLTKITNQQPSSSEIRLENKLPAKITDQQPRSKDLEITVFNNKTDNQTMSENPRMENKQTADIIDEQTKRNDHKVDNEPIAKLLQQQTRENDLRLENKCPVLINKMDGKLGSNELTFGKKQTTKKTDQQSRSSKQRLKNKQSMSNNLKLENTQLANNTQQQTSSNNDSLVAAKETDIQKASVTSIEDSLTTVNINPVFCMDTHDNTTVRNDCEAFDPDATVIYSEDKEIDDVGDDMYCCKTDSPKSDHSYYSCKTPSPPKLSPNIQSVVNSDYSFLELGYCPIALPLGCHVYDEDDLLKDEKNNEKQEWTQKVSVNKHMEKLCDDKYNRDRTEIFRPWIIRVLDEIPKPTVWKMFLEKKDKESYGQIDHHLKMEHPIASPDLSDSSTLEDVSWFSEVIGSPVTIPLEDILINTSASTCVEEISDNFQKEKLNNLKGLLPSDSCNENVNETLATDIESLDSCSMETKNNSATSKSAENAEKSLESIHDSAQGNINPHLLECKGDNKKELAIECSEAILSSLLTRNLDRNSEKTEIAKDNTHNALHHGTKQPTDKIEQPIEFKETKVDHSISSEKSDIQISIISCKTVETEELTRNITEKYEIANKKESMKNANENAMVLCETVRKKESTKIQDVNENGMTSCESAANEGHTDYDNENNVVMCETTEKYKPTKDVNGKSILFEKKEKEIANKEVIENTMVTHEITEKKEHKQVVNEKSSLCETTEKQALKKDVNEKSSLCETTGKRALKKDVNENSIVCGTAEKEEPAIDDKENTIVNCETARKKDHIKDLNENSIVSYKTTEKTKDVENQIHLTNELKSINEKEKCVEKAKKSRKKYSTTDDKLLQEAMNYLCSGKILNNNQSVLDCFMKNHITTRQSSVTKGQPEAKKKRGRPRITKQRDVPMKKRGRGRPSKANQLKEKQELILKDLEFEKKRNSGVYSDNLTKNDDEINQKSTSHYFTTERKNEHSNLFKENSRNYPVLIPIGNLVNGKWESKSAVTQRNKTSSGDNDKICSFNIKPIDKRPCISTAESEAVSVLLSLGNNRNTETKNLTVCGSDVTLPNKLGNKTRRTLYTAHRDIPLLCPCDEVTKGNNSDKPHDKDTQTPYIEEDTTTNVSSQETTRTQQMTEKHTTLVKEQDTTTNQSSQETTRTQQMTEKPTTLVEEQDTTTNVSSQETTRTQQMTEKPTTLVEEQDTTTNQSSQETTGTQQRTEKPTTLVEEQDTTTNQSSQETTGTQQTTEKPTTLVEEQDTTTNQSSQETTRTQQMTEKPTTLVEEQDTTTNESSQETTGTQQKTEKPTTLVEEQDTTTNQSSQETTGTQQTTEKPTTLVEEQDITTNQSSQETTGTQQTTEKPTTLVEEQDITTNQSSQETTGTQQTTEQLTTLITHLDNVLQVTSTSVMAMSGNPEDKIGQTKKTVDKDTATNSPGYSSEPFLNDTFYSEDTLSINSCDVSIQTPYKTDGHIMPSTPLNDVSRTPYMANGHIMPSTPLNDVSDITMSSNPYDQINQKPYSVESNSGTDSADESLETTYTADEHSMTSTPLHQPSTTIDPQKIMLGQVFLSPNSPECFSSDPEIGFKLNNPNIEKSTKTNIMIESTCDSRDNGGQTSDGDTESIQTKEKIQENTGSNHDDYDLSEEKNNIIEKQIDLLLKKARQQILCGSGKKLKYDTSCSISNAVTTQESFVSGNISTAVTTEQTSVSGITNSTSSGDAKTSNSSQRRGSSNGSSTEEDNDHANSVPSIDKPAFKEASSGKWLIPILERLNIDISKGRVIVTKSAEKLFVNRHYYYSGSYSSSPVSQTTSETPGNISEGTSTENYSNIDQPKSTSKLRKRKRKSSSESSMSLRSAVVSKKTSNTENDLNRVTRNNSSKINEKSNTKVYEFVKNVKQQNIGRKSEEQIHVDGKVNKKSTIKKSKSGRSRSGILEKKKDNYSSSEEKSCSPENGAPKAAKRKLQFDEDISMSMNDPEKENLNGEDHVKNASKKKKKMKTNRQDLSCLTEITNKSSDDTDSEKTCGKVTPKHMIKKSYGKSMKKLSVPTPKSMKKLSVPTPKSMKKLSVPTPKSLKNISASKVKKIDIKRKKSSGRSKVKFRLVTEPTEQKILRLKADALKKLHAVKSCGYCHMTILSSKYKYHLKLNHPYRCARCSLLFKSKAEKYEHWKEKHNAETYHCITCNKKFEMKSYYEMHARSSTHRNVTDIYKKAISLMENCLGIQVGPVEQKMISDGNKPTDTQAVVPVNQSCKDFLFCNTEEALFSKQEPGVQNLMNKLSNVKSYMTTFAQNSPNFSFGQFMSRQDTQAEICSYTDVTAQMTGNYISSNTTLYTDENAQFCNFNSNPFGRSVVSQNPLAIDNQSSSSSSTFDDDQQNFRACLQESNLSDFWTKSNSSPTTGLLEDVFQLLEKDGYLDNDQFVSMEIGGNDGCRTANKNNDISNRNIGLNRIQNICHEGVESNEPYSLFDMTTQKNVRRLSPPRFNQIDSCRRYDPCIAASTGANGTFETNTSLQQGENWFGVSGSSDLNNVTLGNFCADDFASIQNNIASGNLSTGTSYNSVLGNQCVDNGLNTLTSRNQCTGGITNSPYNSALSSNQFSTIITHDMESGKQCDKSIGFHKEISREEDQSKIQANYNAILQEIAESEANN